VPDRLGGILLHPTSLPGPGGIGELGPEAVRWLDWLTACGCGLWQVLPLGPTGYGDSPYQSFSAFAGNHLLISFDLLQQEGLLEAKDLVSQPSFPDDRVDFGPVIAYREGVLRQAAERYRAGAGAHLKQELQEFTSAHAGWLEDYTLFMALKAEHGGAPWTTWEGPLRRRDPEALKAARLRLGSDLEDHRFRQFLFFRQWEAIRREAHARKISLIGDVPIFVAHDSADVWARPELFYLDEAGDPSVVAGVPPDYFSPTGQLWGNPLYRWDVLAQTGYEWWIERFRLVLQLVDVVRLDHFRGFEAYWEVPGGSPTAEKGRWVPGPGAEFLEKLRAAVGGLPIIAEDLGKITPPVIELRDRFGLPGMRILQFGFEGRPEHEFLPHNYPRHCVVYTGTHDNDTVLGWYQSAGEAHRDFARRYLGVDGHDICWDMIRCAWASVAEWAIVPLQDVLGLGAEARMNFPSKAEGNWAWRCPPGALTGPLAGRLQDLTFLYGRLEREPTQAEPAD
jgi:4-alpha-glucanotransferase